MALNNIIKKISDLLKNLAALSDDKGTLNEKTDDTSSIDMINLVKEELKRKVRGLQISLDRVNSIYEEQKELIDDSKSICSKRMRSIAKQKIYLESIIKRLTQLILSMNPDGLAYPVYNFPLVCINNEEFSKNFSKYLLKCIITNANAPLETSEDDLWYAMDSKLHNYEQKMCNLIEKDYSVKKENVVEFLSIYADYLFYAYKKGFDIAKKMNGIGEDREKSNVSEEVYRAVIAMGSYLVYKKTGIEDVASRSEFRVEINGHEMIGIGGADFVRLIEENDTNKAVAKPTEPVKETPKKPVYVPESYKQGWSVDEVYERMRYVDETTIEEELKNLNIPEDLKNECRAQVRNRRLRIEQELYEMQMRECLNKYLSTEDIQLYESCKGSIDCRSTIEDIDAALELLMNESDEESIALIQSEIEESLEVLRMMNRPSIEEKRIQEPIYYAIYSPIDDLSIPKALESIQQMDKGFYKQAYSQLNKNQFSTNGSREVMGDHLPCRVYETGSNVKVFFAKIGDVDIIIDCLPRNGKEYSSIVKTVTSLEFKIFLDTVSKTIRSGKIIDTSTHRQMIMDELSKSKLVSKSME